VHIRRGDQLKYGRRNAAYVEQRYVPNVAFVRLIDALISSLEQLGDGSRYRVVVLCEGAAGGVVPDVDGTFTNFSRALKPHARLELLDGPKDAIDAFEAMCNADVLVTSKSGFSHLAALLCDKPVVLAVPSWLSYDCVPNALPLSARVQVFRENPSKKPVRLAAELAFDQNEFHALFRQQRARLRPPR